MILNSLMKKGVSQNVFRKNAKRPPVLRKKEGKSGWEKEKGNSRPVYGHKKTEEASSPKKKSIWVCQDAFGICK
jgi:hypothetical protein